MNKKDRGFHRWSAPEVLTSLFSGHTWCVIITGILILLSLVILFGVTQTLCFLIFTAPPYLMHFFMMALTVWDMLM
jgi:uncharacterized integral membrane protein